MITVVGFGAWLAGLILLPVPLAARILLLAPLVVVPTLLGRLPPRPFVSSLAGWPALVAALALLVSFAFPAGPVALALTIPWLLLTGCAALGAVLHGLLRLPGLLHPGHASDLGIDVALGLLAGAAVFTACDRLGIRLMGFSSSVILLTGVHFHFAGFGLLTLASLFAGAHPRLRLAILGLIVGIPLTAVGFVVGSDAVNAVGAVFVGVSGIAVALAFLATDGVGRSRWLIRGAGAALLVGMPMGIARAVSVLFGLVFVDLETMIRTHGTLNAAAVLAATLGMHRR